MGEVIGNRLAVKIAPTFKIYREEPMPGTPSNHRPKPAKKPHVRNVHRDELLLPPAKPAAQRKTQVAKKSSQPKSGIKQKAISKPARNIATKVKSISVKQTAAGSSKKPKRRVTKKTRSKAGKAVPVATTQAFNWTAAKIKLLGTMSDSRLAERLKIGSTTVFKKRRELKVPPFGEAREKSRLKWKAKHLKLLGTVSDEHVANLVGVSVSTVTTHRKRLGIPSIRQTKGQKLGRAPRKWKASEIKLLGVHPDGWVAKKLKMGRRHVYAKRLELGIASMTQQTNEQIWTPARIENLGMVPDSVLAEETGLSIAAVSSRRSQYKIPAFRDRQRSLKQTSPKRTKGSTATTQPRSKAKTIKTAKGTLQRNGSAKKATPKGHLKPSNKKN